MDEQQKSRSFFFTTNEQRLEEESNAVKTEKMFKGKWHRDVNTCAHASRERAGKGGREDKKTGKETG